MGDDVVIDEFEILVRAVDLIVLQDIVDLDQMPASEGLYLSHGGEERIHFRARGSQTDSDRGRSFRQHADHDRRCGDLLRLPRRIQYFAANRVAPYLPLFSMFQPEDKEDEANRTP